MSNSKSAKQQIEAESEQKVQSRKNGLEGARLLEGMEEMPKFAFYDQQQSRR